jgi:glycosyltransferase involved in cell wall biosynthesis
MMRRRQSAAITGAEPFRACIPPVPPGGVRPRWSVMIPTYHCAEYLIETLESVLAQDPGPEVMQIEVIDDCSIRDDPESVVREVGRGRVAFFRQPRNVGHVRNFNTCLRRARGHLIHLLHGDDLVRGGFYSALGPAFESAPGIGAAFCQVAVIDGSGGELFLKPHVQSQSGPVHNALRRLAVDQPIQTPSIVVRRSVYERVGGFDRRFARCGEDLEMWLRIASAYRVWYEPRPLAFYRTQTDSLSGQAMRTGQNIRETRLALDVARQRFPVENAAVIEREARQALGVWAVSVASSLARNDDHAGACSHLREALSCSWSRAVLGGVSRVLFQMLLQRATSQPGKILRTVIRRREQVPRASAHRSGETRRS